MLNLCANLKEFSLSASKYVFSLKSICDFSPQSQFEFALLSAVPGNFGSLQNRPIAISAYKFNVNPDFNAAKEIVYY